MSVIENRRDYALRYAYLKWATKGTVLLVTVTVNIFIKNNNYPSKSPLRKGRLFLFPLLTKIGNPPSGGRGLRGG